tara:strand:- start:69 stop:1028 length:960 start_codon:yes stop_codon:yes gene_type:complete
MAYIAGDTITAAQYNVFVASSSDPFGYNHFAGTGSGEYGLGQTELPQVTAVAGTVTAAQFNTLMTGIDNIANHTNVSITARTQVSAGDTIAIKSALETDLAALATAVAAGSTSASGGLTNNQLRQVTTGSTGWNTATHEISVTFANANTMRHYFNAGGKIRLVCDVSGSVDGDKDTVFTDLGTGLGNLDIGSLATTRSGSSETLTTNNLSRGYRDLTTSYQNIIKLTSDNSNYTDNSLEVQAKLDASVDSATVITVKIIFLDGASDGTFTSGNTAGVPADPNNAPQVRSTVTERHPNDSEGLAAAIQSSSNAQVSNSTG